MRQHRSVSLAIISFATLICACDKSDRDAVAIANNSTGSTARAVIDYCYVSPQSVLLGPSLGRRNVGHAPGWIRLEGMSQATSGAAELIDANGSGLSGGWSRHAGDSLLVVGSDDFLRTELTIVVNPDSLHGRGDAHSDADIELDSAGVLGDLRRKWAVKAVRGSCDSMPRRSVRTDH